MAENKGLSRSVFEDIAGPGVVEEWDASHAPQKNPWRDLPAHYVGRWAYDYDERLSVFFVHCGGHRILDAEDSEVCEAVCRAHNSWITATVET